MLAKWGVLLTVRVWAAVQLDEDALLNTAAGLVESRRQMAEGLGAAIHKRAGR